MVIFRLFHAFLARNIIPIRRFPKLSIEIYQNSTNNCILVWNLCHCKMAKNIWKSEKHCIFKDYGPMMSLSNNYIGQLPRKTWKDLSFKGIVSNLAFYGDFGMYSFCWLFIISFLFENLNSHFYFLSETCAKMTPERFFSEYFPQKYPPQKYTPQKYPPQKYPPQKYTPQRYLP